MHPAAADDAEMPHLVLRRSDLAWLLLLPVYLVIGTFRHELSHAAVAVAQGATITEFVILPSFVPGGIALGYVLWDGEVDWLATAAPYAVDVATVAVGVLLLRMIRGPHWLPVTCSCWRSWVRSFDSAYGYGRGVVTGWGDIAAVLGELRAPMVHGWFIVAITIYAVVAWRIVRPLAPLPPRQPPGSKLAAR